MKASNKFNGIEFKTLLLVLLFSIGLIFVFWICETKVFDMLYKRYQINKLNDVINEYQESNKDIYVLSEELAYDNEVCISVVDSNNIRINYNVMQHGCLLNDSTVFNKVMDKFLSDNVKSDYYKLYNSKTKTNGIIYAFKNKNKNVFIYSNLENASGFLKIFRNQIIYFIFLLIIISIMISIFIASKVTKPIREITMKAKKIGEGKYDNDFPKNGVFEIEELSQTLENVQQELSKSDELKRDLIANVSHDLKTPLTMIKAYAEMIKDISYKDKDKMDEHLDIIMEESDRLTNLVNDVLELSKAQSNVNMYNYVEYDLVKEIKKIIKRYSVIKETESYQFVLDLPRKAMVKADKDKINQVIYNLLNNAINYTGKDKLVTIRVTKEDDCYLVEIIDTGKGIKEEELPYIWDKYYKNDKNHQRNVVSTGLGLSIVKEILKDHNFKYGVKSKINKGTTFYFKINI